MKPLPTLAALALLALVLPRSPGASSDGPSPDRPIPSLVPARCSVFVEGSGLLPLLEQGLEHPFASALARSPLGRSLIDQLPVAPCEALARASAWLGTDLLPLLASLARGGAGLGFDPGSRKSVAVLRGNDPAEVERALDRVFESLERQLGWPGALDRPARTYASADVWNLGEARVARRGALLVLGNDEVLFEETLALCADPAGQGLLARAGFAELHERRPADAALWAWADLAAIEPVADEGFRRMREANRAPAAQGLLGAELAAMLSARALGAAIVLHDGHDLALELAAFEAPCVASLAPLARGDAAPAELSGDAAASALLYRDYSRYLTRRGELFPPEVLPAFAEAITNGALFFGGQDLGEEVLDGISPWIRLVAREIQFDRERRPEIPLPAAALVAVLADEHDGEDWISAFQGIVSIASIDRAQKGGRGMGLHLTHEGAVEISAARFASPRAGDGVDVRYNLQPAIAVVGRHLVLGTHEELVRQIVRELTDVAPLAMTTARETLELDAAAWRRVLEQNVEVLVAQKMLDEGLERAAAEREVGGLALALASFDGVRIELSADAPEAPTLHVELRLAAVDER